jgi:nifR3 family TIM-barrel protein
MRIGHLHLDVPFVQAALSGYSDAAMRRVARLCGAPYTLAEVVLDKLIVEPGKKTRRHLELDSTDHPVGGQLLGSEPDQFGRATHTLVEAGFDVIDINFGCPVPKVLGRCRGGFLLSEPARAIEIVRRVRDAAPPHVPVTVKMRRGLDDSAASRDQFFEIFDAAFALGVAAITVHGRTVRQRYDGPSCRQFLAAVKRHAGNRVVLGSGDLFSAADAIATMRATGVDGVTIARGAIGNPWVFRELRALWAGAPLPDPPSLAEQRAIIWEHYRIAMQIYGPEQGSRIMRKFGIKYARLHPEPLQVRDAFVAVDEPADWQAVLERWYAGDAPGRRVAAAEMNEACPAA